jgi:hypothetical protein
MLVYLLTVMAFSMLWFLGGLSTVVFVCKMLGVTV